MDIKVLETYRELFENKIDKSGYCWLWMASRTEKLYGVFAIRGKTYKAHRISYMLNVGEIPVGMCVLHRCDVPSCVNPDHLWIGTKADNNKDMDDKLRRVKPGTYSRKYKYGEKHHNAKLTCSIVLQLRQEYAEGLTSYASLAKKYGFGVVTIYKAVKGITWNHI